MFALFKKSSDFQTLFLFKQLFTIFKKSLKKFKKCSDLALLLVLILPRCSLVNYNRELQLLATVFHQLEVWSLIPGEGIAFM